MRVDHEALLREPVHDDVGEMIGGDRVLALRGVLLARQDRREDGRRAEHADADATIAVHHREPLGEADRCVLGHRVGDGVGDHEQAGRRRDVEQVSAALLEHVRDRVLRGEDLRHQVDADDLAPPVVGGVDAAVDGDPGVGDEQVDPPETVDRRRDEMRYVLLPAYVRRDGNAPMGAAARSQAS